MDDNPHLRTWQEVEEHLRARGREAMPEEVLDYYRPHYERFAAYLDDCERLLQWAMQQHDELKRQLGGRDSEDPIAFRKRFATLATRYRLSMLLFAALDGRLDRERIRRLLRDPNQARQALSELDLI
jgi:hypothetical protein